MRSLCPSLASPSSPARLLLLLGLASSLASSNGCSSRHDTEPGQDAAGVEGEGEGTAPGEGEGEGDGEGEGSGPTEGEGEGSGPGEGEGEGEGTDPAEGEGEGAALPQIGLDPPEIDFGYVAVGQSASRYATVRNDGGAPLQATGIEPSPLGSRDFQLAELPDPLPLLAPGESFRFRVDYHPSDAEGDESAVFVHSNDPRHPQRGLLLRARRKASPGRLEVLPAALDFGRVGLGGQSVLDVIARNAGELPIQLLSAALQPGGDPSFGLASPEALPFDLAPGEATSLGLVFAPTAEGPLAATLRVTSDALSNPVAQVELRGEGLAAAQPCIRVSPAQLAFGAVHRGERKAMTFVIVSCGAAPLTVQGIARGAFFGTPLTPEFEVTAQPAYPLVLQPRQQTTVEVSYSPGAAGMDVGFLEVLNDGPSPRTRVDLSASGLQPQLEDVDLHLRLTWDSDDCDVDLHLLRPGGDFFRCPDDCHYQNATPDWGVAGDWHDDPFLDLDDVDGFGPENINLEQPRPGRYRVMLHYYLDYLYGGDTQTPSVETDATVEIYGRGVLLGQWTQHLDHTDRTWIVADIDFPGPVVTPVLQTFIFPRGDIGACPIVP